MSTVRSLPLVWRSHLDSRVTAARLFVGLCAVGLLLLFSSSAFAGYGHPYISSFGSFSNVQGVAVESVTGTVYVYDAGSGELLKFDASGNPADFSSTATNAIAGVGSAGGGEGEIAVDNSSGPAKGDIYVAHGGGTVEIFNAAGENIGELTEENHPWGEACGVSVDAGGNVYVGLYTDNIDKFTPTGNPVKNSDYASSISGLTDVCNVGADSLGNAYSITWSKGPVNRYEASQFGSLSAIGSTVDRNGSSMAIDPSTDEVYVDEQGKVSQFGPAGEPFEEPLGVFAQAGPGAIGESIGIALSGYNKHVYVSSGQGTINVFGPGAIYPDVVTGEVSSISPEGATVSATVSGTVNPSGLAVTECKVEYGLSVSYGQSAACSETPAEIGAGSAPVQVHADMIGLTPEASYHYRLVAANANGVTEGSDAVFNAPAAPTVSAHSTFSVARTEADLGAEVNPKFAPTSYHIDFGPTSAYGQSTPESQPLNVVDDSDHLVRGRVVGLTPGTTYHFRLVATNLSGTTAGPDTTFTTYPPSSSSTESCADEARREAQGSTYLPDCRAFEMVSPAEKEGTDVNPAPAMAAIDGNRFLFYSRGSFAGEPTTLAIEGSPYIATRSAGGWTTVGSGLPNGQLTAGGEGYAGFTADMSKGVIVWDESSRFGGYDPAARLGYNLYMHDSSTGAFELLNGTNSSMEEDEGFYWGSADLSKLAIQSTSSLVPGTHCDAGRFGCAWEWDKGTLRLASVLPEGQQVEGVVGNELANSCGYEHAMSNDGERLFFTRVQTSPSEEQLYAREGGAKTILLSGSERTLPGGASGFRVNYQDAEAAHGDRVLFTTRDSLLDRDEDETNDLYMYDYTKPVGERLTLVSEDNDPEAPVGAAVNGNDESAVGCAGVVATSEDLRRVYFVSDNQIVAGGPTAPGPKLYLWDDTGSSAQVAYIATLDPADERVWASEMVAIRNSGWVHREARWNRDGRYLAFISRASLTGYENEGQREIYRYDAVSGGLDCVTCTGGSSAGEVTFQPSRPLIKPLNHPPQNVSDGGEVFFETTRPLVLGDTNGQRDVYEYGDDDVLHLISKGTGDSASSFLDATPSGSDAFFTTRDQLSGWDRDGNLDVYDARVDGGLPEPDFTRPSCEGEACLPSPSPPVDSTPASFTFSGAGNLAAAQGARRVKAVRCKAGRVRAHGVCRKRARVKKHRKRRVRKHKTRTHG